MSPLVDVLWLGFSPGSVDRSSDSMEESNGGIDHMTCVYAVPVQALVREHQEMA